jgi:Spy/CpxP family protein refolding chaperone
MFCASHLLQRRETLGLPPEQVTRLSTLETESKAAREKAANDSKPHREQLEKLLQQSTPDVAQVRVHAQALMQVQQAAGLSMITTAVQAKAVLTPEQRGRVQGWAEGARGPGMRGRGMNPGIRGRGMGQGMRRPGGPGPMPIRRGMPPGE